MEKAIPDILISSLIDYVLERIPYVDMLYEAQHQELLLKIMPMIRKRAYLISLKE
jgi:uncharacterized membrane protein